MRRSSSIVLVFALLLVVQAAPGCGGSGGGSGGGGGADDGKFHPPKNGKAEGESQACSALVGAIQARFQALSCVGTTRQCPDFLRAQFGACRQYDDGTVHGCADHYAEQMSCDDLNAAVGDCVVAPIGEGGSSGCPN